MNVKRETCRVCFAIELINDTVCSLSRSPYLVLSQYTDNRDKHEAYPQIQTSFKQISLENKNNTSNLYMPIKIRDTKTSKHAAPHVFLLLRKSAFDLELSE